MSGAKAALKAIAAAIKAQKYDDAIQEAQKLLLTDPKSYQASLFLGFASSKQKKNAEAEKAYESATRLKPSDPQAWQGLIQLYEQQGSGKLDLYQNAALKLAEIYQTADDKYKCQVVVDTFIGFAKNQGTRLQYKKAQEIVLPDSPIYDYLEGRIPHPSQTYQIMAQITEFEEKERINKNIGERRTRLGAKIGQVTVEVKREVLRDSDLEDLYEKIIDWSNDDEIRRQYEEKLLQRCLEALTVLPPGDQKIEKRNKVLKLANDMVIIKHPFKLAWDIAIEWTDPENIQELDVNILRQYCSEFPTSGLAQVIRGFLSSEISPFPKPLPPAPVQSEATSDESEDDEDDGGGVSLDGPALLEDRLLIMTEGMADAGKSILAHRLMGEYYQFLEEYESVVELMRNGRRLVTEEANKIGLKFTNSAESVTALLATALVFYQSPKNHPEAKTLFDGLLVRNPTSTPALIGIGLIYEEEEDYPAAIDFLGRALERDSSNIRIRTEAAWVKALNGDYVQGKEELEQSISKIDAKDQKMRELFAQTQYRVGVCMWNIDTSKTARKDRSGAYSYFLAALKSNLNFAPAYTSLGIYYADYSKDKKRSRKCFQKAFELSSSEVEAAERLARIFAEQGEWELVEVVAQRVVDSGKVRPSPGSKKKGVSWPFAALGVAELNKLEYAKSIVSFQSALRITPSDYHCWVGLGESYHNSGRYIAATKAFQHAEKFEREVEQQKSGETWFAKHMLANVKRELGDYDEAIEGYKRVLEGRPTESGVAIALLQALLESAWNSVEKGLFGHAVRRATETIDAALDLVESRADAFNLWRAVGDACSIFTWVQSHISDYPHAEVKQLLQTGNTPSAYNIFDEVDSVGVDIVFANGLYPANEEDGLNLTRSLHAAILAHKRAIHASAHDMHAQAVAYYNLGWAEHRAHVCVGPELKKKSTRYLKAAVRCFKRAIELEAGNSEFWNALGVVTSDLNPKVAQHSFVRSLFLNERSAQAWTNLGTLYLLQNDFGLANDAFTRAQSSDPDFAHAWVGQGLLALLMTGDTKEANLLFTHAIEISESSSLITQRQYAQSTFDQILASKTPSSITELVQPLFALNQLQSMAPTDLMYQHLSTLFLERINDVPSASAALSKICVTVEADYEVTESPSSLSRFALAKADLARSQLSAGSYSDAIDNGETALQLSAEDAGNELSAEARQKCRLSAHLTVGLAYYFSGKPDTALQYFLPALEESNGNPDAVCLLAQILWAKGDEESRNKAREHLFDCVENYPEHVQSVLLLGIIAILEQDSESLEAVSASLQDLRAAGPISDREQGQVGEVLRAIAALSGGNGEKEVLTEIQTDVFLHPNLPHGWGRLAEIEGDDHAAEMALKTALKAVPPQGELEAVDLSGAFGGTGKVGDAQKAIMFAPWTNDGWASLSDALTGRA
ncbi:TPR-like protein [Hyaloscypha variabilis F]|uniref:TPR-like protein n=1 Tax=Hyaloscypha variabilis (strain UAMH 11265 / GT02V1 / F) TaxID=1149755 RepID=A0A2J6RVR9_HYAVF|nr:TPR-like protein [Hyaloscypha variabilis F]